MEKKITAPRLFALEHNYFSIGQKCILNDESAGLLNTLLDKLAKLQWNNETERWRFWVSVPRGTIEDFDYADLHERDEYETDEEYEKAWKEWFPNDEYWYEITVVAANGYAVIVVNNSIVLNVEPNTESWNKKDYADFLQFLIDEVDNIINLLKDGSYAEKIKTSIPIEYRMGIIKRNALWSISPKRMKHDLRDLTEQEIACFISNEEQDKSVIDRTWRIQDLTAQKYYDACAVCYRAARLEGLEGKTAKEQYGRYADDRDGGLTTIDDNSVAAFEKWFDLNDSEKWKIQNPSHMWEICQGSSYTRIHLYVNKDDAGYYLGLAGGVHCRTEEIVRMYNALRASGFPVRIFSHQLIAKAIRGMDYVGIVPCTDTPSQYWYGGFPLKEVISFINLTDEDFSEKMIEQITEQAEWLEMSTLTLIDG